MMNSLPEYAGVAMSKGYFFECTCGEIHRTAESAWGCRKCRSYLWDEDFADRTVTDLRTRRTVPRSL
jgi:ribosomal protein L37AE/L43A